MKYKHTYQDINSHVALHNMHNFFKQRYLKHTKNHGGK